jgi:signal-transduction protein with cAMP-binding, CBS, and nucleotidyltransferase domain
MIGLIMAKEIRNLAKQTELINKIPYLKEFHSEDKETLSNLAYFIEFAPQEEIIAESSINTVLYFLIKGKVDILKGDNLIINLRGGGRLFGEMSFMNHSLTTASVKANDEVVMLCFNISDLHKLDLNQYARLQISLYKSIAEILVQKLMATTDIAKSFSSQVIDGELN